MNANEYSSFPNKSQYFSKSSVDDPNPADVFPSRCSSWPAGLFQGLQRVVPSAGLVRDKPLSSKGSRAQRLAQAKVAHRELLTSR